MIKRIFKVTIDPSLRTEFESDFREISVQVVESSDGLISLEIGEPTKWNPEEYLMISNWADEKSLVGFAGAKWNEAAIPDVMKKYAVSYSVDHFYLKG